jgi:hypothetical protein
MSIRNQPTKAIDAEQKATCRCASIGVLPGCLLDEMGLEPTEETEDPKQLHLFSEEDYHRG